MVHRQRRADPAAGRVAHSPAHDSAHRLGRNPGVSHASAADEADAALQWPPHAGSVDPHGTYAGGHLRAAGACLHRLPAPGGDAHRPSAAGPGTVQPDQLDGPRTAPAHREPCCLGHHALRCAGNGHPGLPARRCADLGSHARKIQRPRLSHHRRRAAALLPDAVHPVLHAARWRTVVHPHGGPAAADTDAEQRPVHTHGQSDARGGVRLRPHCAGAGHAGVHRLCHCRSFRPHRLRRDRQRAGAAAVRRCSAGVDTGRAVPACHRQHWLGDLHAGLGWCGLHIGQLHPPAIISRYTPVPTLLVFLGVIGGVAAFGPIGFIIGPVILVLATELLRYAEGSIIRSDT